jgi:hypothetical protein
MLTINTKIKVYQERVLSTLLYSSEAWTLYKHQEQRPNKFHNMRNLRRLLGITLQDRISNADVLVRAGMSSMFATLSQRPLCWLVNHLQDGRWTHLKEHPVWQACRPVLRYKDVCKRGLKSCNISPADLKTASSDRSSWQTNVKTIVKQAEEDREIQRKESKSRKQQRTQTSTATTTVPTTDHTCSKCGRRCSSRIGLFSHNWHCSPTNK